MTADAQAAKTALVDAVAARAREGLDGEGADALERFVRAYYAHVPFDDLSARSELDLCGAALAHWNLARVRRPGEIKVHVYTPDVEQHGWASPHTVVETVVDDMPFLVDSISMAISRMGRGVHLVVSPIISVQRGDDGRLLRLDPDAGSPESLIHVEIDRQADGAAVAELEHEIECALRDVQAAVADWPLMLQRVQDILSGLADAPPPVPATELADTRDLLQWMHDGHFTFLGCRDYDIVGTSGQESLRIVPATGLGILRETTDQSVSTSFEQLPAEVRRRARERTLLTVTKANSRATVHRPAYLDYVGVKRFDAEGEVSGERRILGLFTHTAYRATPWEIPVVRRKAERVLERSQLPAGSHDYKALVDILETYPRDELFQVSDDELYDTALGILALGERQRVRLFVRRDTFARYVSCLVYLPRDRFHTENRRRIQEILQDAFGGHGADYSTRLSESVLACLHYVVYTEPGSIRDADVGEVESLLAAATRAWTDDLRDALFEQLGEERAGPLFERYRDAFPGAYREDFQARRAVLDIKRIEQLDPAGDLALSLHLPRVAEPGQLGFKLLRSGGELLLSDVLPLLENMGVRVVDERPYEIRPGGEPCRWIYDFTLQHDEGVELDADDVRETFQDAFASVWRGEVENDGFNRLVLSARLTAREIIVLRAVAKYLRQAGSTFSQAYMEDALDAHPGIARRLVALFTARLDPEAGAGPDAVARSLERELEEEIDAVASLDEDRILRGFLRVVRAVLRTNYFQTDASGRAKPYLSLKLDPQLIPDLPEPRPMFEIFVYSPRVEAVHLRGGKVARGGIRWSDRREDFRTEVLGLMKAQTVKNAVIVPVGAKGGFVVKRPPAGGDRAALLEEVAECYRTFIRGLLDVTDTIAGGEIVAPPSVVRHDGDDPYLVVAADKGTATFSDLANAVSEEYGFWLGDAFASGGSTGYDHKRMGITARGAWESVMRHFRELGLDVERGDFTAVGIGDMSGDVFGNGMLLSRRLKLIAAFDHRHVFLDPDPDPEAAFVERERLFRLPGSSWADYDAAVISTGGGVYPRSAKSISLSPEAQAALGLAASSLTPNAVVQAILRAPVDLLWNGGIGTYVKAGDERHADVGDRTNDAVRVDAGELRCRVVGEGGNLGFTQRARVEYALGGGRIFMDAIDNSAGVDCSDHEVNIKILLDSVVRAGDLTGKQRDALLADMAVEVERLVLRDNYEQAQAIATAAAQPAEVTDVYERYMRNLEQWGVLNRALEFLPGDDVLAERKAAGTGFVLPEFAILLSYSKIALSDELLASDLPDESYFLTELERYFPSVLAERFPEQLHTHPLRREIVVSRVVNDLVNHALPPFAFFVREETGASAADVARAYAIAREVFGLRHLWAEIDALGERAHVGVQSDMLLTMLLGLWGATRWLLRNRRHLADVAGTIARCAPRTAALADRLADLLGQAELETLERRTGRLAASGVPSELAGRVTRLEPLVSALDIVEIASAADVDDAAVAEAFFALGARLDLPWLRKQIAALPRRSRWEWIAWAALRDDVNAEQAALTGEIVRTGTAETPRARLDEWLSVNRGAVERCVQMLADIRTGGSPDLARLTVAVREIRNLIYASDSVDHTHGAVAAPVRAHAGT